MYVQQAHRYHSRPPYTKQQCCWQLLLATVVSEIYPAALFYAIVHVQYLSTCIFLTQDICRAPAGALQISDIGLWQIQAHTEYWGGWQLHLPYPLSHEHWNSKLNQLRCTFHKVHAILVEPTISTRVQPAFGLGINRGYGLVTKLNMAKCGQTVRWTNCWRYKAKRGYKHNCRGLYETKCPSRRLLKSSRSLDTSDCTSSAIRK